MSPEALGSATKAGRYVYASDVWSAGCALFQLVAGHPPFDTWEDHCQEPSLDLLKPLRATLKRTVQAAACFSPDQPSVCTELAAVALTYKSIQHATFVLNAQSLPDHHHMHW